jgi:hypothetical protein
MNDNAKKWVAALRSGEYKKGRHFLRTGDTYCCLGVACDLYDKTGWELGMDDVYVYKVKEDGGLEITETELPLLVSQWLGLASYSGYYSESSLVVDNDLFQGKTFEEIAAIIESEPEGLFNS